MKTCTWSSNLTRPPARAPRGVWRHARPAEALATAPGVCTSWRMRGNAYGCSAEAAWVKEKVNALLHTQGRRGVEDGAVPCTHNLWFAAFLIGDSVTTLHHAMRKRAPLPRTSTTLLGTGTACSLLLAITHYVLALRAPHMHRRCLHTHTLRTHTLHTWRFVAVPSL
eukprot:COSAG06_NODE_16915_length_973_cov_1.334096_1_plen_167_part_00